MAGIGKATVVGLGAAATAFGKLSLDALTAGGELEQNIGGAGAVFGAFAESIEIGARDAFKNAGLSMSDYLATANKMGALLQGVGLTADESWVMVEDAMQRAADVASIMGIDVGAAMEAVAGAAKGNFTMMDNLGVAMNDTAIKAYALSSGFVQVGEDSVELQQAVLNVEKAETKLSEAIKKHGKDSLEARDASVKLQKAQEALATASTDVTVELTQQEKITLAMEMFLEKTAYAAGNYAKENETLAGSLSTAKAALTNFLSGAGDADAVVESVGNVVNVVSDKLQELLPRLTTGLTSIAQGLIPMIPPLLGELLPPLIEGASALINGVVTALPDLLGVLIDSMPMIVDALLTMLPLMTQAGIDILVALIDGITAMMPDLIPIAVEAVFTLVEALIDNVDLFIDASLKLITGLADGLVMSLPILAKKAPEIVQKLIEAIVNNIGPITEAAFDIVFALAEGIIANAPEMLAAGPAILISLAKGLFDALVKFETTLLSKWKELFFKLFPEAEPVLNEIWDNIVSFFTQAIPEFIHSVGEWFKALPETIKEALASAVDRLGEWANDLGAWASEAVPQFIENVQKFFEELPEKIGFAIGVAIGTFAKWVLDLIDTAKREIPRFIATVLEFFKTLPGNIADAIKAAIDNLKKWVDDLISAAKTEVPKLIATIIGFMAELPQKIWDAIISAKDKVIEWASQLVNTAKTEIPKFASQVWDGVKDLPGKFLAIGRDIVSGFVNGIKETIGGAVSSVKGFFGSVIDGVKSVFDQHSPSKVFAKIAENNIVGFIGQTLAMGDKVSSAMDSVFGDLDRDVDVGLNVGGLSANGTIASALATPARSTAALIFNFYNTFNEINSELDIQRISNQLARQTETAMRTRGILAT